MDFDDDGYASLSDLLEAGELAGEAEAQVAIGAASHLAPVLQVGGGRVEGGRVGLGREGWGMAAVLSVGGWVGTAYHGGRAGPPARWKGCAGRGEGNACHGGGEG